MFEVTILKGVDLVDDVKTQTTDEKGLKDFLENLDGGQNMEVHDSILIERIR